MRDFPLRRPARRGRGRNHPRLIFALAALGLGLLGFATFGRPAPLVIYNASASAPIGFYYVIPPGQIRRGELVLAHTPESVRSLAAKRHYLPANVPLVKRVEALGGDTVCAIHHAVTIDGRHVADQLTADRLGRPLPDWSGCRTLRPGQIFLLMEGVPDSFDGRYFGPIPASTIIGRLVPLWLR
nr:S26 family signal peptidase [uncultured Acidocella sp.]